MTRKSFLLSCAACIVMAGCADKTYEDYAWDAQHIETIGNGLVYEIINQKSLGGRLAESITLESPNFSTELCERLDREIPGCDFDAEKKRLSFDARVATGYIKNSDYERGYNVIWARLRNQYEAAKEKSGRMYNRQKGKSIFDHGFTPPWQNPDYVKAYRELMKNGHGYGDAYPRP